MLHKVNEELYDSHQFITFIDNRDSEEVQAAALWGKSILYDIQTYHPTPVARKTRLCGQGCSLKKDAVAVDEFYRTDRAADVPNQENTIKYMNSINPLRDFKVYQYDEFNPKIRCCDNFVLLGIQYGVVASNLETMFITNDLMSNLYELVAYSVFNRIFNEHIADCCNDDEIRY